MSTGVAYRAEVDGLRAIAVLAVVFYHLGPWIPHGYLGVDVFFVISGYVVCRSVLARDAFEPLALGEFFLRRIKRLFPALLLMTLVTGLVGGWLLPPAEFRSMAVTAAASMVGASNWVLLAQGADYFGVGAELNLFTHTWSLAVEEQFYLLVAPVLLFARPPLRSLLVAGVGTLSLLAWLTLPEGQGFYGTHARLWQLALGVLLALKPELRPGGALARALAGLGGIALGWAFLAESGGPLLASLAAALLIAATDGANGAVGARRVLGARPVSYVGRLSYSLYLWHWPLIVLCRWTLGDTDLLAQVVILVLSLLLAAGSYHAWERPLRRSAWTPFPPGRPPVVGALALLHVPALAAVLILGGERLSRRAADDAFVPHAFRDLPAASDWGRTGEQCHHRYDPRSEADFLEGCLGSPEGARTLYLVGDLHAIQLGFAFRAALAAPRAPFDSFRLVHNDGVPMLIDEGRLLAELDWLLRRARPGDVVALSFYRGKLRGRRTITDRRTDPLADEQVRARGARLAQTLDGFAGALAERGVHLLLIQDGPRLRLNVRAASCLLAEELTGRDPCALDGADSRHDRLPMDRVFEAVLAQRPDVVLWDYHDLLCPERCGVRAGDGTLLMIDHNHTSRHASESLGPALLDFLSARFERPASAAGDRSTP